MRAYLDEPLTYPPDIRAEASRAYRETMFRLNIQLRSRRIAEAERLDPIKETLS